jgi:SHS2 domain-containing protein
VHPLAVLVRLSEHVLIGFAEELPVALAKTSLIASQFLHAKDDSYRAALVDAASRRILASMAWATHSLAEHVGELAIRLEADSPPELFAESARALAEVMLGRPANASGAWEHVWVKANDRDALLVAWLDELIYRAERDYKIYGEVQVQRVTDCELDASVRGEPVSDLKTQVKAATWHGLEIVDTAKGVAATVVLDV